MTSVVVAWISGGQVEHRFMDCMIDMIRHDSMSNGYLTGEGGFMSMISSPRIAEARSQLVDKYAKDHDADWLLMLDTDMTFEPTLLDRLMDYADADTVPIIGGLCFGGRPGHKIFPTVYEEYYEGEILALRPSAWYPKDQLVKVGGTGAACLLVHRRVFGALKRPWPNGFGTHPDGAPNPMPWFVEGLTGPHGEQYGEDIAFCKRARQLDIPVHVHTGVKLGHLKQTELTEEMFEAWRDSQEAELRATSPNRSERRRRRKQKV